MSTSTAQKPLETLHSTNTTTTTTTPAATFSYAQAAKGVSSAPSSAQQSRKPSGSAPSGTAGANPAEKKIGNSSPSGLVNREEEVKAKDGQITVKAIEALQSQSSRQPANGTDTPTSPEFGLSSVSTLVREDDVSSAQIASSEATTWENKSQSSTQEKGLQTPDETPRDSALDAPVVAKPVLHDAPPPSINIWKQRAEEQKSRLSSQNTTMLRANGTVSSSTPSNAPRRSVPDTNTTAFPRNAEGSHARRARDSTNDESKNRARRASLPGAKASAEQRAPMTAPLPSMGDSQLWPTPLNMQDEDRRKQHERPDKDRSPTTTGSINKGKAEWLPVAINPSVVFNTPISTTGSRRGGSGRGGARGARESGGRGGVSSSGHHGTQRHESTTESGVNPTSRTRRDERPKREPRPETQARPLRDVAAQAEKGVTSVQEVEVTSDETTQRTSSPEVGNQALVQKAETNTTTEEARRPSVVETTDRPVDGAVTTERQSSYSALTAKPSRTSPQDQGTARFSDSGPRRHSQYNPYSNRGERPERGRGSGRRGGITHGFPGNGSVPQQATNGFIPSHGFSNSRHLRGSSRAFSIPSEQGYGRAMNGYNPAYLPHLQTVMPNPSMHDYNMYPMTAVPFDPYGQQHVLGMITTQLDYYFSVENLIKDVYLRKHMDSQGFAPLSFVAGFNRLKTLSQDFELIKAAAMQSAIIEHQIGSDGRDYIRKREDWEQWIFPMADRNQSAQHDGLIVDYQRNPPVINTTSAMRHQSLPFGVPQSAPGVTGPYPPFNLPFTSSMNGHMQQNHGLGLRSPPTMDGPAHTPSPKQASPASRVTPHQPPPAQQEKDAFSDDRVNKLRVVYSDLDSNGVQGEAQPQETAAAATAKGALTNGHSSGSRSSESSQATLNDAPLKDQHNVLWFDSGVARQNKPLPKKAFYVDYLQLRADTLRMREMLRPGFISNDMQFLYDFWSNFLVVNFNSKMYEEFKTLAVEDASHGSEQGMLFLLRFYDNALKKMDPVIRSNVAADYVALVQKEVSREMPAFKQLRAAWRDGSLHMRNRKRLLDLVDGRLREALDS